MLEEERALELAGNLCVSFNNRSAEDLVYTCWRLGTHWKKIVRLVPPSHRVIRSVPYDGTCAIDVYKTLSVFLQKGKDISLAVGRKRVPGARAWNLALLYDDSNSMTAWWRSDVLNRRVQEKTAPQAFAKIAALSLYSAVARDAKLFFIPYATSARAYKGLPVSELISLNGSGATRLDLALDALHSLKFERFGGEKYVVILSDGVPESGRGVASEDSAVQEKALSALSYLSRLGCRIIHLSFAHEKELAEKKIGGHNMYSFANRLRKIGCRAKIISNGSELSPALFRAFKEASA